MAGRTAKLPANTSARAAEISCFQYCTVNFQALVVAEKEDNFVDMLLQNVKLTTTLRFLLYKIFLCKCFCLGFSFLNLGGGGVVLSFVTMFSSKIEATDMLMPCATVSLAKLRAVQPVIHRRLDFIQEALHGGGAKVE